MYVIYLNTEIEPNRVGNAYGYWTGKSYIVAGERYPTTVDFKNEGNIKVYKSKKVAEKSAEKAFDKFGHVLSVTVENYEDVPELIR